MTPTMIGKRKEPTSVVSRAAIFTRPLDTERGVVKGTVS